MCVEITHEFGAVLFLTFHPVWFYAASVIASQQLRERSVLQLFFQSEGEEKQNCLKNLWGLLILLEASV